MERGGVYWVGGGFDQAERKIQIDWVLICRRASAASAAAVTPPPFKS